MAINPSTNTEIGGRITAATSDYPYGSSKNETSSGANDGTPYVKSRSDDIFGFQQALLLSCGITPSGNADSVSASQYLQAIVELISGRAQRYDDSGSADAYVLSVQSNQYAPAALYDGLTVIFYPANTNTGAATANLVSLGSIDIKLVGGITDPIAGDINTDVETTIIYRTSPAVHWELQKTSKNTLTGFRNLIGGYTSTTTSTWTADKLLLSDSSGETTVLSSYSQVLNTATSGAGGLDTGSLAASTWYYVFAIYGASGTSILFSTSATSPTLPSGYTYSMRIGSFKTDSLSNIVGFTQYGRDWNYKLGSNLSTLQMASGSTSGAWVATSTTSFVPTTAKMIFVGISASNTFGFVAPNNNYSTSNYSATSAPVAWASSAATATTSAKIPLETTNIYYNATGAASRLLCYGFTDNL